MPDVSQQPSAKAPPSPELIRKARILSAIQIAMTSVVQEQRGEIVARAKALLKEAGIEVTDDEVILKP